MLSHKPAVRRLLPVLFFCALAFIVVACGGSAPSQTSNTEKAAGDKQTFIFPETYVADIKTFDPALVTDVPSNDATKLVFSGLLTLNDKKELVYDLAQSYSVAPDGVTWTFKLKPNLKFSDGSPLTSEDVVFSINRYLLPETKSGSASSLDMIKDYDKLQSGQIKTLINDSLLAPDPQTVTIITGRKAQPYFAYTLSGSNVIISKKLFDKYGPKFVDHISEGAGSGPWTVQKYDKGVDITFIPNPNYNGAKPQLKKIVMVFYKDSDTSYRAYQTSQVSMAPVPSSSLDAARNLPNKQFRQVLEPTISYYTMNYLVKPFDNIKIRQAFALALDKEAIVHSVYKDDGSATNHIVPQGTPGYNQNLAGPLGVTSLKGDKTKARQLLEEGMKEEGYTPATFPQISLSVSAGSSDIAKEVTVAQQMWQNNLGISVKINAIDFNKLLDDMVNAINNPNGLQMWRIGWQSGTPDPLYSLTYVFGKGSSYNYMNYGNNKTSAAATQQQNQALMAQADGNTTRNERFQQYNQAEQQLINDVAWLPVYQPKAAQVYKTCVQGVPAEAYGMPSSVSWSQIYISKATPCANTDTYK